MAFRFSFFPSSSTDGETAAEEQPTDAPADSSTQQQQSSGVNIDSSGVSSTSHSNEQRQLHSAHFTEFATIETFCTKYGFDEERILKQVVTSFDADVVPLSEHAGKLRYLSSSCLRCALLKVNSECFYAQQGESDIIPNVYLGGLKVWSCTRDVVNVLFELAAAIAQTGGNQSSAPRSSMWFEPIVRYIQSLKRGEGTGVVTFADVGCGLGLCGVAALVGNIADSVLFFDYNEEIAKSVVATTLKLNCLLGGAPSSESLVVSPKRRVAAGWGDWMSFLSRISSGSGTTADDSSRGGGSHDHDDAIIEPVHVIVAADVSYDEETTEKFMVFAHRLLRRGGLAIVGTKAFYFGTNGGLDSILRRCCCNSGTTTHNCDDGGCSKLHLLCQSPAIGGEQDMLRYVVCLVKK